MQLGLVLGYWGSVPDKGLALAQEAERLGYHSVWVAEAYGTDAFTPLAWIGAHTQRIGLGTAIAQIPARTPAMTAMTVSTLDMLTNGRTLLGLGVSGPQVVEGWHGLPYGKPLVRTREYVAIVRDMLRREGPTRFQGEYYRLPYDGPDATGLGRPLKLIQHPVRSHVPIYLGAMGPKNVALAAEIADGWFPHMLSPLHLDDIYLPQLAEGFARAGHGKSLADFDVVAQVYVTVGDDLDACRRAEKKRLALILGGYGARTRNFYVNTVARYGYAKVLDQIQDLYLSGNKKAAEQAIPDELVDELTVVGPRAHVKQQLDVWRRAGIRLFAAWTEQPEALRMLAELEREAG
jgi:F420-dependent oxidoreductase-like protein